MFIKNAPSELQKAIMQGNTSKVRSLLKNNQVDVNERIRYSINPNIAEYIPLIWAAEKGYKEITNLLLNHPNINVNIKDSQGFTALMCAAEQGHNEIIELLLKQSNIDVNIQNNKGATALMLAVKGHHKNVVIQLINYPNIDINIETNNGGSALMYATLYEYDDIADLLRHPNQSKNIDNKKAKKPRSKGKEVSKENNVSNNSVKAIEENHSQSEENYEKLKKSEWLSKITMMKVRGEDFNKSQNSDGWTILMYATLYAYSEVIQNILGVTDVNGNRIIDINVKNKYEDTALTIAILKGDEKKMKLLLGYDVDKELTKNYKILILKEWMLKIVRMRRRKEDFNAPLFYFDGKTLLMCACSTKYANCSIIYRILKEKDNQGNRLVNINAKDSYENTALTIAAQTGDEQKMRLLMEFGANIELAKKKASSMVRNKLEKFNKDIQMSNGSFASAILSMNFKKAMILLKNNLVVVNASLGIFGNTILMCASDVGNKEGIELLLKYPYIDVNIKDCCGITALMCASARGYEAIVKMLLEHGASVNIQDIRQHFSALMCASEKGRDKVVKLLLDHGAIVDVQGTKGQTPLMLAEYHGYMGNGQIEAGHMKVIKMLLEHNANINIRYINGETVLILAVAQGSYEVVKLLLEHNADNDNKNKSLMIAVAEGYEKIVDLLLKYGADVNFKNHLGITPIMIAIMKGHERIVDQLIKHGANINCKSRFGITPLICAIKYGYVNIVKLLLENKADIYSKDLYGLTPLIYAIESRDARIVKLLLDYHKEINFNMVSYYGETLQKWEKRIGRKKIIKLIESKLEIKPELESQQIVPSISQEEMELTQIESSEEEEEEEKEEYYEEEEEEIDSKLTKSIDERFWEAISQGDVNKVDSLLEELEEKKIDCKTIVNARNKYGDTALIICSRNGHINVMRSLLECNADLSLQDNKGDTALLISSDHGDLGAVRLLLSNGADPTFKDSNGNNALIRAAKNDRFDVVEELIYRKGIINAQGQNDRTALMFAAENGYLRMVKLLIKKDAKINTKDCYNKTALEIVKEKINKLDGDTRNKKEKKISLYNNLKAIKDILEKKVAEPSPLFEDLLIKTRMDYTWDVAITDNYKENQKFWEKNNPAIYNKIKELIKEIKKDPFRGMGRPKH